MSIDFTRDIVPLIGYLGSLLILISMMMSNIVRLRIINIIGASTFAFYGLLIHAYPVFIMDGFIALVSVYHLLKMRYQKHFFLFNRSYKGHEMFPQEFLKFYQEDILKFFPTFNFKSIRDPKLIIISRKLNPVGLFIYEVTAPGTIQVHLDYACPAYRDSKNFFALFSENIDEFKAEGLHTMFTDSSVKIHQNYLLSVGFKRDEKVQNRFWRSIE